VRRHDLGDAAGWARDGGYASEARQSPVHRT
jgi:hypothetical protein